MLGAIKQTAARMCADRMFESPTLFSKVEAATMFLHIWKKVSFSTLINSWRVPGTSLENFASTRRPVIREDFNTERDDEEIVDKHDPDILPSSDEE